MTTEKQRHLVWFSCGIASAAVAKLAVEKYPDSVEDITQFDLEFPKTGELK